MTAVAIPEPASAPVPYADRDPIGDLTRWATAAEATHRLAVSLVNTSFVPAAFRGKANEATAAILAGAELGLSPMASLKSFDVIQGVAAPRAITLRAVVQAQGHEIWVEESTEDRAVVRGRRKGSSHIYESVWDTERARKMGLLDKDQWKKQKQNMLVQRGTAECARLVAADAILGIAYSAEELRDADVVHAEASVARPASIGDITGHKAAAAPEPEAAPAKETASVALTRKMWALVKQAGREGGDETRNWMGEVIGRVIQSSKDMTAPEVRKVIAALEAEIAADTDGADPVGDPPLDPSEA